MDKTRLDANSDASFTESCFLAMETPSSMAKSPAKPHSDAKSKKYADLAIEAPPALCPRPAPLKKLGPPGPGRIFAFVQSTTRVRVSCVRL